MKKGIDYVFLHYGIKQDDTKLIEQAYIAPVCNKGQNH